MTHVKYWVVEEDEEVEEIRYSNILEEEEYEEDDDSPEGFEGLQKGSELDGGESSVGESGAPPPTPWDPSESFFAYI
jgi:hypothetical protein